MPTDIALVLKLKAEAEAQALKDALADLMLFCLWAALGLILAALMSKYGFDPAIAQAFVVSG
jgi:hypothetical protein